MNKIINHEIHPLEVSFDWKNDRKENIDLTDCQTLTVRHYNTKKHNFDDLPYIRNLKKLIIISSNIETLIGIEKYPDLESLELSYVSKILSIDNISSIKTLKLLSIFNAKRINDYSVIGMLENVEVLRICDSGDINDINFISYMHSLKSFSFSGSNIVDGNLYPILNHVPVLEFVGFNNKRHYSHSWEDICKQLKLDDLLDYKRSLNEKFRKLQ